MIYTFYSYKGGVGRSMALANLAQWFYLKGLRVVMVDWDLEAPGLENFFYESSKEIEKVRSRLGLIDLLTAYKREYPYLSRPEERGLTVSAAGELTNGQGKPDQMPADIAAALDDIVFRDRLQTLPPLSESWIQIKPDPNATGGTSPAPEKGALRLISAGWRAGDRFPDYAREVQNFDWSDFYQNYCGKIYFEWLRNQLEAENDIVLIDSRTGVTEMSGVCTQDLADVVVSFCAPNVQNLTGVAQMARAFVRDELRAARQPRPLPTIAILPTRIENSEDSLRAAFKEQFFATLQDLRASDQDRCIDPEPAWKMRIPYIPKYAYAEKLAIGAADGNEDLIEAYNKVGGYLGSIALSDETWVARTDRSVEERFRQAVAPVLESVRPRSGVFLAFSDQDGREFAARLEALLKTNEIVVWEDRTNVASGLDLRQQIASTLSQVEFLVLVVTKAALESNLVRLQWRLARQHGVCVYAVKGSSDLGATPLPRWLRKTPLVDIGLGDHIGAGSYWRRFLQELTGRCRSVRVPFAVDELPQSFVNRPAILEQVIANLVDPSEDAIAGVVALRGPGGCGKALMATAACHSSRVQDAFDDGVVWITLGQNPQDLKARVDDLIFLLRGEPAWSPDLEAASYQLAEELSDRCLLIVIGDVWSRSHLRPFLQGGPQCTRLITTRNFDAIPSGARVVAVGPMNQAEAVALLATDLPAEEREGMNALADRVGEMPLALTLINRLLRHRVHETSQTLSDALTYVNSALDKRGPSFFDPSDEADQETIAKTFGASLDLLTDDERARYQELAVFPPGTDIPVSTVQKLWQRTGNLDEFDTEELFSRFNRLSILDSFDAGKRQIRIHRLIHQYLVETQRAALPALHRQLLEAHRPNPESAPLRAGITARIDGWAALPDDEPYLWDNLSHHLVAGGLGRELVSTVLNLPYLAIKTSLCGTLAVESDLSAAEGQAPEDEVTKALAKRFKQNGHIISRGKDLGEIASTLFCRLSGLDEVRLVYLESCLSRPYLAPAHLFPDLPSPSLLRVFVGHSRSVTGCAFGNDGTLIVSASKDKTLKLWDAKTGRESGALRGHVDEVNACAISGDGSLIVSAAADKTLIVWDTATQTEIRRIFGHSQSVLDCQIFPDGRRILSASADGVLKVWDAMTGELLTTLSGHEKPVNGCAVSCDGKLALSCSDDGTLKLWDTDAGGNPISTQSHRSRINDCALITSPILLIGAFKDRILKTWLSQRGQWSLVRQSTLRGHTRKVNCCAVNQEGTRIISGSADHMVKVWDMDSQRELATLRGHTAWVNDCAISPDDKTAVTASNDGTLRLWDLSITSDPGVLSKHTLWTTRCAISADGKILITSSDDNNVRIWDTESGQEISVLRGHKGWVRDCAMSSDGSIIVSASWDRTVGVWDARTGERQHTLKYPGRPNSCAISRDGSRLFLGFEDGSVRLVDAAAGVTLTVLDAHPLEVNRCAIDQQSFFLWSASSDKTVKVWEISTGKLIKSIEGHSGSINDVAISPDGSFAVSASSDSELRVWDASNGKNRFTLKGHSEAVLGCAISTDGALIASVSRDSSLKVWDASQGRCLATLYTDAWLFGCAWFPDGKQLAAVGAAGGVYFVNYVQDKDSSIGSPGIRFDAARAERPAV